MRASKAGDRGSSQTKRARREVALPIRSQTINTALGGCRAGKNDMVALGGGVLQTGVNATPATGLRRLRRCPDYIGIPSW